ncbi:MAG: helix-turn-helix transcriptional regulator [Nitrospinae bacterium]|nr:helix-turn-helix transcriptional regulator [Nitrospinota bacterium]
MCNLDLKISILKSGKYAYQVAQELGWHPTKLSQIISGVYIPDQEEKELLANAIGVPVAEIFPEPNPQVAV